MLVSGVCAEYIEASVDGDMARNKSIRPVQFGKYTLLNRIGSGGMAEIFRAKMYGAHGFEKEVAIKKILPNLTDDTEFIKMFIDEAKITVGLMHNNVVQVFDLGEIERQYFICMEFVHGKDLLDVLARCAEMQLKVPLKLSLFTIMEMLKGLEHAHRATDSFGDALNIIHRDVSPSNVMLSYSGNVKIGDFGVAKAATQRSMTEAGTLKGKVGYMSPEQVRGDRIDHRSDVFSAGIILYEVLNMRRLFTGNSDLDVMLRVRDINASHELAQGITLPDTLHAIMRKALARDPNKRFQSAGAFHDALLDFVFTNNIRVTNSDIARFLTRIFEKEIAEEKELRLQMRQSEKEAAERSARGEESRPVESIAVRSSPRHTQPPPEASLHEPVPDPSGFRYRDRSGLVYGPMSVDTLTNLLAGLPLSDSDRISTSDSSWRSIEDFPDIAHAVQQRKDARIERQRARRYSDPSATPVSREESSEDDEAFRKSHLGLARIARPVSEGLPDGLTGRLDQDPFARLLFRIWSARAGGCLHCQSGDTTKDIYFANGNPTAVDSNKDAERLGTLLVQEDVVTQEQLNRALALSKRFGGRLGDALVADRAILSHVLYQYLFRQAKIKLLDVFTWTEGTYHYVSDAPAAQSTYPLGIETLELLLQGLKKHYPEHALVDYFKRHENQPLMPSKEQLIRLEELRLSAREFRIATAILAGGHTVKQLIRNLALKPNEIQRIAFILLQLDLVQFEAG